MIVYLDGKEVRRLNVYDGPEAYDLVTPRSSYTAIERWVGFYRLPGSLEPGEHTLAISVHNRTANEGDLGIGEISLWGTPRESAANK